MLTIPQDLRPYRSRALEAMANVGGHAWDVPQWDGEMDAQAYCLDAIDSMPAGSTIGFTNFFGNTHTAIPRRFLREKH